MKSIHLLVSSIVIALFAFVVVVGPPNIVNAPKKNQIENQIFQKPNADLTISKEFCEHAGGIIKTGDTCIEGEMNVGRIKESDAREVCCQGSVKKQKGVIINYEYEAGEVVCGKCYCLEAGDDKSFHVTHN